MREIFKKYDVYFYMLFAYIFSIACRYIWVYQFNGYAPFHWHGQLMINTNDGYYFATVVKHLLYGTNPDNQLLQTAIDTYPGTVYSVYYLTKFLPFSLDTIILYMPAFVSSLIVIPIILIMRLYKLTFVGFLAALLASITWSFYNRTMTGYFDTDMFALVFPVFILYYVMKFVKDDKLLTMLIASIITAFYVVFYPQGYAAISAIFVTFIVYGLVFVKDKKQFYLSLVFMSIALIKIMLVLKLLLLVVSYFASQQELIKKDKNPLYIAIASVLFFILAGDGYGLIMSKIGWYTKTGTDAGVLHFYDVAQTIREAGKISFDTFANRISGSVVSFIIALAGYILLVFKKKEFLLFIPLIGIGFFAYIGGLRFTVYAIPAMAIGAVYLAYFIIERIVAKDKAKYALLTLATVAFLYPNIRHIIAYKVPTVFNQEEVKILDKLKNIATPKDYTLTWWDYGYPIWYYSDTNTLIDGGKHHADNFIISQILTTDSQMQAANLARTSVKKYVKKQLAYTPVADYIFEHNGTALDANDVLDEMRLGDYKLPKKTRDIYLYLPNRMLNIFPTVAVFSNLDLNTGNKEANHFFFVSRNFKQVGNKLMLGHGVSFLNNTGELLLGNRKIPIKHFSVVSYNKQGKLQKQDQILDYNSRLNMIYMKSYNTILVLDDKMYNSVFIQLFVFENYNHELFEPVILNPLVKIYKLKR
ncbi:STT3 domain-containing protein [Sulfurimonas sp.]|uniref:STT3 domain-containing protein n=1 Tax=Sulfurimonas sp. TaxID=2022749 RepID=UPI00262977A0|nr:STT3 domain-containing protein [Sulfurimonas sp.]